MQVGDAIRSARLARGLSQDRLADALGVARNTIGARSASDPRVVRTLIALGESGAADLVYRQAGATVWRIRD